MKTYWRVLSSVTLAAIILTGCGTAGMEKETVGSNPVTEAPTENAGEQVILDEDAIAVELFPKENMDLVYEFTLKNTTDKDITLTFSSLQEFDFILKAEDGSKVYQYSEDMMFGEAFVEKTIPANDSISMEINLYEYVPSLESGMYSLEVWSVARESDILRTEIEITNSNDTIPGVTTASVKLNGIVDNHSIEVTDLAGEIKVYQITDEVKTYINDIPENEDITINYYEDENGQLIISSIITD